jgi:hypothetical protein
VVSSLLTLFLAAAGLTVAAPQTSRGPAGPSLDRPCSFVTAAEMSSMLGTRITAATDEHFRCKYVAGNGWLETKLLDISLKITRDIYEYNKAHGKAVPGVGDQAYVLGATLVAKVGDVVVVVDGSNVPSRPDDAKLKAVAAKIVRAIP